MRILLNYMETTYPNNKLNWMPIETLCKGGMNQ
jgi:hypothetical protein